MKTLIAFTGGLDSTWLAYKVLTQTRDDVVLFWLDYRGVRVKAPDGQLKPIYGNMLDAEAEATQRVTLWLGVNVRPVELIVVPEVRASDDAKHVPGTNSRSWRVIPMMRHAAIIARHAECQTFMQGRSPENINAPGSFERIQLYKDWWSEVLAPGTTFETPLVDAWEGRPHAVRGLPGELFDLVLTCNNPVVVEGAYTECGRCGKCVLTLESKRLLDQGRTPDAVLDMLLRARGAGKYAGRPVHNATMAASLTPFPESEDYGLEVGSDPLSFAAFVRHKSEANRG